MPKVVNKHAMVPIKEGQSNCDTCGALGSVYCSEVNEHFCNALIKCAKESLRSICWSTSIHSVSVKC